MRVFTALALSILLVLSIVTIGCTPEDDTERTFSDVINDGKKHLIHNEGAEAALTFEYARTLRPDDSDANFGVILGQTMALMNLGDLLVGMFQDLVDAGWGDTRGENDPSPGYLSGDELQIVVEDVLGQTFESADKSFITLAPGPDFEFALARYDLNLAGSTLLSLSGQFDKSELYLFGGVVSAVNAIKHIVYAHNLDLNFNALYIPSLDFENDLPGSLRKIAELIDSLLNDPYSTEFLTLNADDGSEQMVLTAMELGNVFDRLFLAFDHLKSETDPQNDDPFHYFDATGNGRYDPANDPVLLGDALVINPKMAMALSALFANLRNVFWEGTSLDENPGQVDVLTLAMFNDLLIAMGVLRNPVLPEWISLDVSQYFLNPSPTGLKDLLLSLGDLLVKVADLLG